MDLCGRAGNSRSPLSTCHLASSVRLEREDIHRGVLELRKRSTCASRTIIRREKVFERWLLGSRTVFVACLCRFSSSKTLYLLPGYEVRSIACPYRHRYVADEEYVVEAVVALNRASPAADPCSSGTHHRNLLPPYSLGSN